MNSGNQYKDVTGAGCMCGGIDRLLLCKERLSGAVLAFETTGPICSVALRAEDGRLYYRASAEGLKHLTSLLPMTKDVLAAAGVAPEKLGAIAASAGPGSFTGIRIGVATARSLAQTLRIPVVKVPTLETFVYLTEGNDWTPFPYIQYARAHTAACPVFGAKRGEMYARAYIVACPVFDARRGQMYAGAYMLEADGRIMTLVRGGAHDPQEYFAALGKSMTALKKLAERTDGANAAVVCRLMGDGLPVFRRQTETFREFAATIGVDVNEVNDGAFISGAEEDSNPRVPTLVSEIPAIQDARAVLTWALEHGVPTGFEKLEPVYMRKAEAQRRLDEAESQRRLDDAESQKRLDEVEKQKQPDGTEALRRLSETETQRGSEPFSVRPATKDDVYGISVIERLSFGMPWLEKSILSDLALEYSDYIICEEEGFVLGYAGLHRILDEGHITNIAVHPSVRRRGAGSAALIELMRRAGNLGIEDFTLEVRSSDHAAISFYEKHGFTSEGVRKDYYPADDGGREDALIMWRRTVGSAVDSSTKGTSPCVADGGTKGASPCVASPCVADGGTKGTSPCVVCSRISDDWSTYG